jgi:hypothetical protein
MGSLAVVRQVLNINLVAEVYAQKIGMVRIGSLHSAVYLGRHPTLTLLDMLDFVHVPCTAGQLSRGRSHALQGVQIQMVVPVTLTRPDHLVGAPEPFPIQLLRVVEECFAAFFDEGADRPLSVD